MHFSVNLPLAAIDSARPVFMIVMGVSLMMVAWRMARDSEGWSARLTVGGGFLLCLGYSLLMPMYEAGVIERFHPRAHLHDPSGALAWHAVKLVVMNGGWFLLGLGLGIHSGLLRMPRFAKSAQKESLPANESLA